MVSAQFVLIFDSKKQLLGIMTYGDTKKLVPLGTQIVVNDLEQSNLSLEPNMTLQKLAAFYVLHKH